MVEERGLEVEKKMRIGTNIFSISAQRQLGGVSRALSRSMERLSSGSRITRAGDDAAGLAIANKIDSEVRGLRQAVRNINDSFGFLSVSEGALRVQVEIVQRMRELAVQASNGAIGNQERSFLDTEFRELLAEFNRISYETSFNGERVLDRSRSFDLQVGNRVENRISVDLKSSLESEIFSIEKELPTGGFVQNELGLILNDSAVTNRTIGGKEILVTMRGGPGNRVIHWYESDGAGGLKPFQEFFIGAGPTPTIAPEFHDLTGNGRDELFLYRNGTLDIFGADDSGQWSLLNSYTGVTDFDLGDIDGNGRLDLVMIRGGNAEVYTNQGGGNLELTESFAGAAAIQASGTRARGIRLLDLNGNGRLDLVHTTGTFATQGLRARIRGSDGNFGAAVNTSTQALFGGYWADMSGAGAFGSNSRSDLLLTVVGGGIDSHRLISNGDGSFTVGESFSATSAQRTLDLNGNGFLDLVSERGRIYLNDGNGGLVLSQDFAAQLDIGSGLIPLPLLEDLSGNGFLDLVISAPDGRTHILKNDGTGQFKLSSSFQLTEGVTPVAMDLTGNGWKDLIVPQGGLAPAFSLLTQTLSQSVRPEKMSIGTQTAAQELLEFFDSGLDNLLERLALLGSTMNRLESSTSALNITAENLAGARSQIMDADLAEETASLVRFQILQQAGISVLGQANLSIQIVLQLLESRV